MRKGQNEKVDLEANLVKLGASSETLQTKVDDLARSAATTEADLKGGFRKMGEGLVGRDRHSGMVNPYHRQGDDRRSFDDAVAEGW